MWIQESLLGKKAREFEMGYNDDIAFLTRRSFSTGSHTFVGSNPLLPDFKTLLQCMQHPETVYHRTVWEPVTELQCLVYVEWNKQSLP